MIGLETHASSFWGKTMRIVLLNGFIKHRPWISAVAALAFFTAAAAQNVQRQSYVMSEAMHQELDKRSFDSKRVEAVVNGISDALASKNIQPILDQSSAEIRITGKGTNRLVGKTEAAALAKTLFDDAALAGSVTDESQFILRSEAVGLGGGVFWISEDCLDVKCDQKKTHIVTINLP
jgi:hypothetical protein